MRVVFFGFFFFFFFSTGGSEVFSAEDIPWEWSPYRIRVHFSISNDALNLLGESEEEKAVASLSGSLSRVAQNWAEGLWILSYQRGVFPGELFEERALPEDIALGDPHILPLITTEFDKFTYVEIGARLGFLTIDSKEIDLRTLTVNSANSKIVYREVELADSIFSSLLESFAPVAMVEKVLKSRVVLLLRGGELIPESLRGSAFDYTPLSESEEESPLNEPFSGDAKDHSLIQRGEVFVPYLRILDKSGVPNSVKPVPWTALLIESAQQSRVHCTLESGIRVPLSVRRRGRTEQIAVLPNLEKKPTRLQLQPRMKKKQSDSPNTDTGFLPSYTIFETEPQSKNRIELGKTDRKGFLTIPYLQGGPVRHIYIKEGEILIARIPLIQGWKSSFTIGIPDDETRIAAESVLLGIQEEVIDQIAYREILLARIARFEKNQDTAGVNKSRNELVRLKTREQFLAQLDVEKRKYHSEDPIVQRRIEIMFNNTRKIVDQFMSKWR